LRRPVYRPIAVEAVEVIKLCDDLGDLLNSDYAGHRLTFVQFAQAPHFKPPELPSARGTSFPPFKLRTLIASEKGRSF
jgi:hypothetical protein